MLTVDLDGLGGALAVFGFEEEAEMFSLWASGGEWRLEKTTAEELAGMLSGPIRPRGSWPSTRCRSWSPGDGRPG
jgi:hypothetical protein